MLSKKTLEALENKLGLNRFDGGSSKAKNQQINAVLIKKGLAKETGKYSIVNNWNIPDKKMKIQLSQMGIAVEPEIEYNIPAIEKFAGIKIEQKDNTVYAKAARMIQQIDDDTDASRLNSFFKKHKDTIDSPEKAVKLWFKQNG